MFGIGIGKNGLAFDHTPKKIFEEKVRKMEMVNSNSVKETMEKIRILESEGKYEEAKKLRKSIQSING